jgi:hypothetical protein
MQYILLIYSQEKTDAEVERDPEKLKQVMADYRAFNAETTEAGVFVAGDALTKTDTATTVRMNNGKVMHTDGPFAETKEQLGGYYLLDCKDLDEALAWAAKCPAVLHGNTVEVRPVMVFDD